MKKNRTIKTKYFNNSKHYSNEKRERYANGDVWCKRWDDRIDRHVCIARTAVFPDKCSGCPANL